MVAGGAGVAGATGVAGDVGIAGGVGVAGEGVVRVCAIPGARNTRIKATIRIDTYRKPTVFRN